jgi:hypothetical protein
MLSWIIQITIISFVLIFLVHHLIHFFKSTLTVPKIKDLVNTPTQKYETMYNIINNHQPYYKNPNLESNSVSNLDLEKEYSLIDLLPKKEETSMKSELKHFLKSQLNNSNTNGTDISALDSMSSTNSYSNYETI